MEVEEIRRRLADFDYWYHRIELAPGIVTPGFHLEPLWDHLRTVRDKLDYKDKTVLDIASFDGMFSFEAERKGAKLVVAADIFYKTFSNFLFCREVFGSKAVPYYNVSPYELTERLDVFFDEHFVGEKQDRRFDIVQHFGLLYHLRDPLYSLSQARAVLKPGGKLIIETDVVMDSDESFMLFNGLPNAARVRDNFSVWWAPTGRCLAEMVESTMFKVDEGSYSEFEFLPPSTESGRASTAQREAMQRDGKSYRIGRGALIATAIEAGSRNEKFEQELTRTYRNPGLDLRRMDWRQG